MSYRLARRAEDDLDAIYTAGAEAFGAAQADAYAAGLIRTFQFLASYPRAARERSEATPPVRAHPYKSHLIVYVIEGDDILVARVRHAHEDWLASPM